MRRIALGFVAALTVATGSPAAATDAAAAPRALDPCRLLTAAEVRSVISGPVGKPTTLPAPTPEPPNGTSCVWTSLVAGRQRAAVFGVGVQVWDFRTAGTTWTARWGTGAARYVSTLCTQRAPNGSGVTLPATHPLRAGDSACTVDDTAVSIAKGPFFARVTVGTMTSSTKTRALATRLGAKAIGRLRA